MQTIRKYVVNVANAIAGGDEDGFQNNKSLADASVTVVLIYAAFLIAFSVGAAILSYNYNRRCGTGSTLTVVYVLAAFVFSSFYYPYYAFMLSPVQASKKN